ncbi:UDP-2-acetamido-2,6-dideoxy-hexulose 4-reductase [Paenibacillus albidus]|uniref:UDP-2-acetamido-2,6-dideoxy-hexulose 4-reductase n=1 Tax=Paenibacillus albidus TaxID=2041023 RepID=A0A917BXD0_9BACL|nr:NAD-dependent epimerase/dehydratase family protein [Paenibacillus albidus]GGF59844.1 UDP-2-acetamido-2,6-dideoxy-hexulose 4-reductase [Paenibacillus albidus]
MKGQRLLITGAGGFTGRHAVDYFSAAGAEVTAVLRRRPGAASGACSGSASAESDLFPEGVKVYVCDLSDRQAVATMIADTAPEEVLHLAGRNSVPESWKDPMLYMETNVMATLYLLEAMRSFPSSRILVAGSRLKYRPGLAEGPPHPYSLSKTMEELAALAWGTLFKQPILLAEPCNLIGPGPSTGFCSLLARHIVRSEAGLPSPPFKLSSRYAKRDFLDVRDAVRAYEYILQSGELGTVYSIDSGTPRQLGEITEQMVERSTVKVEVDWGPETQRPAESAQPSARAQLPHQQPAADGSGQPEDLEIPEVSATVLGWAPGIGLGQSLADILEYTRANGEER